MTAKGSVGDERHANRTLEDALGVAHPTLSIRIRAPIRHGRSGARVYLVDFVCENESRFGILKLATPAKIEREAEGYDRAQLSWLSHHIPTHMIRLDEIPGSGGFGLLYSFAKDRFDACQTVREALSTAPHYGQQVLKNTLGAWQHEAHQNWNNSTLRELREIFVAQCEMLPEAKWSESWQQADLPPANNITIILQDRAERWPNPRAYLSRSDLWPRDVHFQTRVPNIMSHGDFHAENVLCPSVHRAQSVGLLSTHSTKEHWLEQVSVIDLPFCNLAPYVSDAAFLLASLVFLLPRFASRALHDATIRTYVSVLKQINEDFDAPPPETPPEGLVFAQCASTIWKSMRLAQTHMVEDIRKAFLASLAGAALRVAIQIARHNRNGDPSSSREAVKSLCLSALALREVLPCTKEHLPKPDFVLKAAVELPGGSWTPEARQISTILQSLAHKKLVLGLGSEVAASLGHPSDDQLAELQRCNLEELIQRMPKCPHSENVSKWGCTRALPLLTVLDWSTLPVPRDAIAMGIGSSKYVLPIVDLGAGLKIDVQQIVPYFHMRGACEALNSLALSPPQRNARRAGLHGILLALRGHYPNNFIVLYVGMTETELRETHEFLRYIWVEGFEAAYIGNNIHKLKEYLDEWNISYCPGKPSDFLTACSDLASAPAYTDTPSGVETSIRVADMALEQDELVSTPGNVLTVNIDRDDAISIGRAGQVLYGLGRPGFVEDAREPREFFVGHRVQFSEISRGVSIERNAFRHYVAALGDIVGNAKAPGIVAIPSNPGAGASTALRWLGYKFAYERNIPTLILRRAGEAGFEAIERLYKRVGRSLIVVTDPQDVPSDEMWALKMRCAPSRYPVIFLTSVRQIGSRNNTTQLPLLRIGLEDDEREKLVATISHHCYDVSLARLLHAKTKSLFLLTLEAFGGTRVHLSEFVSQLIEEASEEEKFLLACIGFFSRFTHRPCSDDFRTILCSAKHIVPDISPYEDLLILKEQDGLTCRHDELSGRILAHYLTQQPEDDKYRWKLADFACEIISTLGTHRSGDAIAAEYIWALLNPQLEALRGVEKERVPESRLIDGRDGLPLDAMRERIFEAAASSFPSHVNILSHFGKFLAERKKDFSRSDQYLLRAFELDPKNEAVAHMIGMRYYNELRLLMKNNPPSSRTDAIDRQIEELALTAHEWFDRARALNLGSEYAYTAPIQLDIHLIEDDFKRCGIRSIREKPETLLRDRVTRWLAHAESLTAEGLRFIEPRRESRYMFSQVRDRLHEVRGDLDTAIQCFRVHSRGASSHRNAARVQLARLLYERGEGHVIAGHATKASRDFEEAEAEIRQVLQDPAKRFEGIKLWCDCVKHLVARKRRDLIEQLEQLNEQDESSLEAAFQLMCLWFAEAVQTGSPIAKRRLAEYQSKSAALSSYLGVRRYFREWLVGVKLGTEIEYRTLPNHLFAVAEIPESSDRYGNVADPRVSLDGVVTRWISPTEAYLRTDYTGVEVYFPPRTKQRPFYKSDVQRARVRFRVVFTYEKPMAFNVTRVVEEP